jgi:aminoglycoside phosphotransferase (APT) family kinase protein
MSAMNPALTDPPPPSAIAWALSSNGGGRLERWRALPGGISHGMHLLASRDRHGRRRTMVLRRWVRPGWEIEDPDFTAAREAAILGLLESTDLPVPRVIALDPDGRAAGAPAILETVVPGRRIIRPRDLNDVAASLAELLPRIHAIGEAGRRVAPPYARYYEPLERRLPAWSRHPERWEAALAVATRPGPGGEATFIHRDFHQDNTLWTVGTGRSPSLSGIVDWGEASWGQSGVDLGHMRWNLAITWSIETSDAFRRTWESITGTHDDPEWDLRTLVDAMPDADNPDATRAGLERLERYLGRILDELGAAPRGAVGRSRGLG